MDKDYSKDADRIVALSDLIADYIRRKGNVSKPQLRRITAYRAPLARMKSDERLVPIANKFTELIKAVEQGNFAEIVRLSHEALALGEDVIT